MEEMLKVVNSTGVPVGFFIACIFGAYKAASWIGVNTRSSASFLAPLIVRLVEATEMNARYAENNARHAEAASSKLDNVNTRMEYGQDSLSELVVEAKEASEGAAKMAGKALAAAGEARDSAKETADLVRQLVARED